jgi:hypothetical protein
VIPYHRFSVTPRPMAEKPAPMQANWLYVALLFLPSAICPISETDLGQWIWGSAGGTGRGGSPRMQLLMND